ncbi:MAG: glycosyltransferase [Smithellaceae bacterium]
MDLLTIALTRYSQSDDLVSPCLQSVAKQNHAHGRVLFLDQNERPDVQKLCKFLSSEQMVFEYRTIPARGCAYARNTAITLCRTAILLWTDPDVVLASDWASKMAHVLATNQSDIVGGKIVPLWHTRPRWYMRTNVMADHYSLIDLGDDTRPIDRIIGGSMGLHVGRLGQHARFDERLGRQDGTLLGGVDAEFCERALVEGFRVHYVGSTVAKHQITIERTRLKWIARKFYYGGLSRGLRGGKPRSMNQKRRLGDYMVLCVFAPLYLAGLLSARHRKNRLKERSLTGSCLKEEQ